MRASDLACGLLILLLSCSAGDGFLAASSTRVELDLADARFIIKTVPGSGEIQIDGSEAERSFKLKRTRDTTRDGLKTETIRFRGTKLHHREKDTDADGLHWHLDTIHVSLPRDRPLDLELIVHRGESEIDLGGLTLTGLRVEMLSGDYDLEVSQPVRGALDLVKARASRGDFGLTGLANLRAREFLFKGSAGDWRLEFDGDWIDDSESVMRLHASMGDLSVKLPQHVRLLEESRSRAFMGSSAKDAVDRARQDGGDAGPAVLLKMRMTMGDSSFSRF